MKEKLLMVLIKALLSTLTPELFKELADKVLDFAEDKAMDSVNKIDDWLVLPVCGLLRESFNIPDND